jgi:hypothetical protein
MRVRLTIELLAGEAEVGRETWRILRRDSIADRRRVSPPAAVSSSDGIAPRLPCCHTRTAVVLDGAPFIGAVGAAATDHQYESAEDDPDHGGRLSR